CLAGLIPASVFQRLKLLSEEHAADFEARSRLSRRHAVSVAACLVVFGGVLTYGYVRRAQADFQPGPRVALVQGNFTTSLKHDPSEAYRIFETHYNLTGAAVRHQPDVIVWPETMYRAPLLVASPDLSESDLARLAPQVPPKIWRESQE